MSSWTTSPCQRTSCLRSMPAVLLRLTTSGQQSPAYQRLATQSSTDSHTWQNCAKCSSSYLHSTADPERLLSMIQKIETDHHGSLLPATVCSLLHVKLNTDQECFRSEALFCPDLLKAARTATDRSNVRSSSE